MKTTSCDPTYPAPSPLSAAQVRALLRTLTGVPRLMASLLYGSGLELVECCQLRVQDVDLDRAQIILRRSYGWGDRVVPLPRKLLPQLRHHLALTRAEYMKDIAIGAGWVQLPPSRALASHRRKLTRKWPFQWFFASPEPASEHRDGVLIRHHVRENVLPEAFDIARAELGWPESISHRSLRHSFAVRLLESGCDVRIVQELMGYRSIFARVHHSEASPNAAPALTIRVPTPEPQSGPSSQSVTTAMKHRGANKVRKEGRSQAGQETGAKGSNPITPSRSCPRPMSNWRRRKPTRGAPNRHSAQDGAIDPWSPQDER